MPTIAWLGRCIHSCQVYKKQQWSLMLIVLLTGGIRDVDLFSNGRHIRFDCFAICGVVSASQLHALYTIKATHEPSV